MKLTKKNTQNKYAGKQGNKEQVNSKGQADNHKGRNRTKRGNKLTEDAQEKAITKKKTTTKKRTIRNTNTHTNKER